MMSKQTETATPKAERPILTDPDRYPDDHTLKEALRESYDTYASLLATLQQPPYGLSPEWNYYKDGKAWLCKVSYKKKTVFWLSVWEGYFKTGFYFTEKHVEDIMGLDIDEGIKQDFINRKTTGKLKAMVMEVRDVSQLDDVLSVVRYKKDK